MRVLRKTCAIANHKFHRVPNAPHGNGIGRAPHSPVPNPIQPGPRFFRPTNYLRPGKDLSAATRPPGFPDRGDGLDDFSPVTSQPAPPGGIGAERRTATALVPPPFPAIARQMAPSETHQDDASLPELACRRDRRRAGQSTGPGFRKDAPGHAKPSQTD